MSPPQIDSGVKSRDVFLCFPKDLPGGLLPDGEDLVSVVTVSNRQRRDAKQVGLEIPLGKHPSVGWNSIGIPPGRLQFKVALQVGFYAFKE